MNHTSSPRTVQANVRHQRKDQTTTAMNSDTDITEIRAFATSEIDAIGGGDISLGTWFSRVIWQMQNAP